MANLHYERRGRSRKSGGNWDVPVSKGIRACRTPGAKPHGPMGPERIKLLAQKLLAKRAEGLSGGGSE